MFRRYSRVALFVSTTVASLAGQPTLAQSGSADRAGLALEEIVVTARKREESLQDVPLSITAFSEKQIEEAGFVGLQDLSLIHI